ncbi:MAG: glycosyltransferase family A protein, partial [Candidatus Nanoarchaeia archaeon]|nr:glycosyltransferase family A protein [Candidatus Nanoarchaeia archaeon]
MKNHRISVIMSAYNTERYIAEAIESILNQTFKDFEFIIIDDGSTDDSLKIIKRYVKKDRRIKLIHNKKNIGLTKSLNKGLKIAKGQYIARMDADDISLPQRFQIQYDFLEKNKDIFLIGTTAFLIDDKGDRLGRAHIK